VLPLAAQEVKAAQELELRRAQQPAAAALQGGPGTAEMQLCRSLALECSDEELRLACGGNSLRVLACRACAAAVGVAPTRRFGGPGLLAHCGAKHGLQR
jgi:hypothetical protein